MEKTYREIDWLGTSLSEVVYRLWDYQKNGVFVSTEFNGHILYSDKVSLDGAYLEVTGKSFFDFEEDGRRWKENYEKEEREFKNKIPDLVLEWKQRGHDVLDKNFHNLWDSIVQIRLEDLYQGMELGNCLEIVKALNDGCELSKAQTLIDKQGHSGMSYGLVRSMVKTFCERGEEFFNYTKL